MPTRNNPPAINTTKSVVWLIGLNVAIYLILYFAPSDSLSIHLLFLGFSPELFFELAHIEPLAIQGLVALSPLGYAFVHTTFFHLAANMVFILAFATRIEQIVGSRRMLIFYGLTAVLSLLGVLISYWIDPKPIVVIGASGAASSLFGGYVRVAYRQIWAVSALFIAANLVFAFIGNGDIRVAWQAHIAGYLAGLVLFPYFLPPRRSGPPPDRFAHPDDG